MNMETSASIEDENQSKECCIFRVPESIRKINEDAHTPKLISIGPLHHGKEKLAVMEKQKQQYAESFLKHITIKMEEISKFIHESEESICNCYAETSELEVTKFVKMIIDDAIFIIELFWRNHIGDRSDLLRNIPAVQYVLKLDLQLLENQLPYFVLEELYEFTSIVKKPTFMDLSYEFFHGYMFNSLPSSQVAVKHFTDLRRSVLLTNYRSVNGNTGDLSCAVKLRESGVKFEGMEGKSLLEISFKKQKLIPSLNFRGRLQIPCLEVGEVTECLLRNIMALEQCYYSLDTHICNYVGLIDRLIDTEKMWNFLWQRELLLIIWATMLQ